MPRELRDRIMSAMPASGTRQRDREGDLRKGGSLLRSLRRCCCKDRAATQEEIEKEDRGEALG